MIETMKLKKFFREFYTLYDTEEEKILLETKDASWILRFLISMQQQEKSIKKYKVYTTVEYVKSCTYDDTILFTED